MLAVLREAFNADLLSITSIGSKRPSIHKRKQNLHNINVNNTNYNENFKLKLRSINLLVNGIKSIIRL